MRSEIDAQERAEIKENMNTALKEEVESDETFRKTLTESAKTRGQRYFEDLASRYGYKATVNFKAPLTHVTLSAVWLLRGRWISTLRNFSSTNRGILSPWHFLPRL
ncbi:MAG: hypothetical protein ACI4AX_06425 [Muribaculaceae bacterium]